MRFCDLIAEIDMVMCGLLWNGCALVRSGRKPFIQLSRKASRYTDSLAEDCNVFGRAPTSKSLLMRAIYDKLKAEDPARWAKLHYLEAKDMLGHDGEGTVDGCHPNDLGMMRQGLVYGQALKKALGR